MSKWDDPIQSDELIIMVICLAVFCMIAVPCAFVIAAIAGFLGLGGTQDMATILVSFGIVAVLGIAAMIAVVTKVTR